MGRHLWSFLRRQAPFVRSGFVVTSLVSLSVRFDAGDVFVGMVVG